MLQYSSSIIISPFTEKPLSLIDHEYNLNRAVYRATAKTAGQKGREEEEEISVFTLATKIL